MRAYVIKRLLLFPVFLFFVSVVTFLVVRTLPGDAQLVNAGFGNANCEECRQATRRELGLDKSLPQQYGIWLKNALQGDFGNSSTNKRPIAPEVRSNAFNSLQLALLSMIFTVLIGVPLGVISGLKRGSVTDYAARIMAILGLSMPGFWLATLVVLLPAIWWQWTPIKTWVGWTDDPLLHLQLLVLPALVLAIGSAAYVARIMRSSVLEVLYSDYIRTARAKGLREGAVVMRHVLRNSLLTLLTVLGLQFGVILGGSVVIESIFTVPGLGNQMYTAILSRDYQSIQILTVLFAGAFITIQLLVDLSYAWVDPRIRY